MVVGGEVKRGGGDAGAGDAVSLTIPFPCGLSVFCNFECIMKFSS